MGHVFLRSLCPWTCFSELSIFQLILSCTSRWSLPWFWQLLSILVQSFSGLFRGFSHKGWAKLPLLFSSFSKAQGLPIHELGLPFTYFKWALAYGLGLSILKGSLLLNFNTCNILDLNTRYQRQVSFLALNNYLYIVKKFPMCITQIHHSATACPQIWTPRLHTAPTELPLLSRCHVFDLSSMPCLPIQICANQTFVWRNQPHRCASRPTSTKTQETRPHRQPYALT